MQAAAQQAGWLAKENVAEKLGVAHVPRSSEEGFLELFPVRSKGLIVNKGINVTVPMSEPGESEVWLREMKIVGFQELGKGAWHVLCEQSACLTVVEYDPGKRPDQANIWKVLRG